MRTPVTPWPTSAEQPLLEVLAERAGALLELPRRQHLDDAQSDGGGQRVAAERRAVLARADDAEHVGVADDGREGQDAAAEGLAEQVQVGHDALAVARERLADPAEAGLDLVGDEEHVAALGDLAHGAEVALRRHDDAGLALHGLDQHGGGVLVDRGLDGRGVPERHRDEARRVRARSRHGPSRRR